MSNKAYNAKKKEIKFWNRMDSHTLAEEFSEEFPVPVTAKARARLAELAAGIRTGIPVPPIPKFKPVLDPLFPRPVKSKRRAAAMEFLKNRLNIQMNDATDQIEGVQEPTE